MKFARGVAFVNTQILLTMIYVLVISPISFMLMIFRKDLLDKRISPTPTFWKPKDQVESTIERNRFQF